MEFDWKEWSVHPCTKDFLQSLLDERMDLLEAAMALKGEAREQAYGKVKAIDSIAQKINLMKEEK